MENKATKNPLTQLADAIRRVDDAADYVERAEQEHKEALQRLNETKAAASEAFGPAVDEAQRLGKQVPDVYQYCKSVVRFDGEGGVTLERLNAGTPFELERWSEEAKEASES
jgi:uncharacterized protein YdhG (YjbR/CyaY superfamily)